MNDNNESAALRRAHHLFRKETQARESAIAWTEYTAAQEATLRTTARLKAQRLARTAAAGEAVRAPKRARKTALHRA